MVGSRSATAAPLSVARGSIHCRAASASNIGGAISPTVTLACTGLAVLYLARYAGLVPVEVEANVAHDDAAVVGMPGRGLAVDTHGPAHELDVGAKRTVRAEDGRDRQRRVIEALTEHLDLHDHVEHPVCEIS